MIKYFFVYIELSVALEYRLSWTITESSYLEDIDPQTVNNIVFDELEEHANLSCV